MSTFLNFDGKLLASEEPVIADRANLAPGDGLFETMRVSNGSILLAPYHLERLRKGMQSMNLRHPLCSTEAIFQDNIIHLCTMNGHADAARVRLTMFRTFTSKPAYIIESWQLDHDYTFDDHGITIGLFTSVAKEIDLFSPFKTVNYHPYRMAANFAAEKGLDDCMVTNAHGNICDSSISNVFWIRSNKIFTPPLTEGSIDGVMRRHLLESLAESEFEVQEKPLTVGALALADEVFLTNIIRGIRPVRRFEDTFYTQEISRKIFTLFVASLIDR